jgi:5,10-methylene-tetrahydrofolate dehydrogenase/methenyl tetrahydrofolate cyclohydrolase
VTATVIDGRAIAARVRQEVAVEVGALVERGLERPGLATILVGDANIRVFTRSPEAAKQLTPSTPKRESAVASGVTAATVCSSRRATYTCVGPLQ